MERLTRRANCPKGIGFAKVNPSNSVGMHLLLILRKWLASLIAGGSPFGDTAVQVGSLALRSIRMLDSAKLQGWIGYVARQCPKAVILKRVMPVSDQPDHAEADVDT